jgi:hypothetical protein
LVAIAGRAEIERVDASAAVIAVAARAVIVALVVSAASAFAGAFAMQRRMKYRLAGRTFRYQVYVFLEVLWAIAATFALAGEFLAPATNIVSWSLTVALAALAIAHSMKMTMVHPWLALKSILFGAIASGLMFASHRYFDVPTNPLLIAAVLASAHYLWLGEKWTAELATNALEDESR